MKDLPEMFADEQILASALAKRVAALAVEAVAARGRFTLAIPGGSATFLLAQGLAGAPLDAARWELFWTDERCVPPRDPQSNFHLAQAELLPLLNLPPGRIHPIDGSRDPDDAARATESALATLFGPREWPRFDLVLLGIGEDGHVASLFPGHPALLETQRRAVPVHHAPKPPPDRITLTLPVLNRARHILVVAAGAGKADALSRVFASENHLPAPPARSLRPLDGDLRWMIDRAATPAAKETP